MKIALPNRLMLLAAAIALTAIPTLQAQSLSFLVDLNTASLNTQDSANAPFYLDFQLNYGNSANAASTVTLSNFTLTGGSALGSPVVSGSASGSLTSTVTLSANSTHPFNELYQQFSPNVTDITFQATVLEPGPNVGAPTGFVTGVFDSSLGAGSPAQLYTTAPDAENLLTLNLNASNTVANVNTYTSLFSADGSTTVTGVTATVAVPEPATTAALFGCAVVLTAFCVRRYGKQRNPQGRSVLALQS